VDFDPVIERSQLGLREGHKVMMALGAGQGDAGFSEGDLGRVLDEVGKMKGLGAVADLILDGQMVITLDEDGTPRYQTAPNASILADIRQP
jgi:hypothetical protein